MFGALRGVAVRWTGSLFASNNLLAFADALAQRCPAARLAQPAHAVAY